MPYGPVTLSFGVHAILALGLVFVPLFDNLGFERAFATGLLSAVTSPFVTLAVTDTRRGRGDTVLSVYARALAINGMMLLPTLVAGFSVELGGSRCSPGSGLFFLLLLAGGNALVGTALGLSAACLLPTRTLAMTAIIVILTAFLGAAFHRLYAEPQIYAYSIPFGYWPGSLYDEELVHDVALWAFRGYSSLLALGVVALLHGSVDPDTLRPAAQWRAPAAAVAAGLFALALAVAARGDDLGFDRDRATIMRALARRVTTDHFVLYIDPQATAEQVEQIRLDHELRFAELARFFGRSPPGRIRSFVYRSRDAKRRLMGGGRTQIARPWAREIHIHGLRTPHPVLKHELAHIFAGELARPPLFVPATAAVFVNIGIVEGIAVAADWPVRELTVHGWARAMHALERLPNLEKTLQPTGFWAISSSRAYTAAGSFIRYLTHRYGMDRFARLYADNDFEAAYGRTLADLVHEWETFLSTVPLPTDALVVAAHRFSRPGIFEKVCAHEAANLRRRGFLALERGDLETARRDLEALLHYAPAEPRPLARLASGFAREGYMEEAESLARRATEVPHATRKGRASGVEATGEIAWRKGDLKTAARSFAEVLALHLSTPQDRLQTARLMTLERKGPSHRVLRNYLLGDLSPSVALVRLGRLAAEHPEDALVQYLYGRALERAGAFPEAVQALKGTTGGALRGTPLEVEAQMSLGRALYRAGALTEAETVFTGVVHTTTRSADREAAAAWRARVHFAAEGRLPE